MYRYMKKHVGVLTGVLSLGLFAGWSLANSCGSKASAKEESKAGCGSQMTKADGSGCKGNTIVDTAIKAGSFKTLTAALEAAGMVETLRGDGPFTVFAPTDAAFASLPAGTVEGLLKDPPKLRAVLRYHVLEGRVMAADAARLSSAKTILGQELRISAADGVRINDARVAKADVTASNGVIHVIDRVLLPADDIVDVARSAGSFGTLLKAVDAAGLTDTLRGEGPFTVFAPTDEAFAKLPAGALDGLLRDPAKLRAVLKYHVVAGRKTSDQLADGSSVRTLLGQDLSFQVASPIRINGEAAVIKADVSAANGVIHVIDRVVLPQPDVLDIAAQAGSFGTLLKAIEAAGLADTLRGSGPFTVFAPTDAAFAKLPAGALQDLLANPEKLKGVLTAHVVAGRLNADSVVGSRSLKTVHGMELPVEKGASGVRVGGAAVTKTDITAANGVIHVIDTVIVPR